MPAEPTKGLL